MTNGSASPATETAVLGGGCFWCLEAVFDGLAGVTSVESGYAGGSTANPSYEAVCTGRTGHAEVVRVTFDPAVLSYRDLLTVFFTIHDPTTKDRQGSDVGTQYRSVIFCQNEAQRATAEAVIAELGAAKLWRNPIVTEIAGRGAVLRGRGVPPGVLRPQPRAAVLPARRRAEGREVPQALRRCGSRRPSACCARRAARARRPS